MARSGLELMREASIYLLLAYENMMDTGEVFSPQHEALVSKIEEHLDRLLHLLGRDYRNKNAERG